MSRPSIKDGGWHVIATEQEFNNLLRYGNKSGEDTWYSARVCHGDWEGPGQYLELTWTQPCPRGCCRDFVRELVPAAEVEREAGREIDALVNTIKQARGTS